MDVNITSKPWTTQEIERRKNEVLGQIDKQVERRKNLFVTFAAMLAGLAITSVVSNMFFAWVDWGFLALFGWVVVVLTLSTSLSAMAVWVVGGYGILVLAVAGSAIAGVCAGVCAAGFVAGRHYYDHIQYLISRHGSDLVGLQEADHESSPVIQK